MLTLYVRTGCPYCAAVIHKMEDLGLTWEEKNVADEGVYEELQKRGDKRREPYLVDTEHNVEMYQSADIVNYLERTFGGKKQG